MFKAVQSVARRSKTEPKKAVFNIGTTLEKRNTVNRKFTYRELTLILGIVVALLVVFMLWFTQDAVMSESIGTRLPKIPDATFFTTEFFRKASALILRW